MSCIELFSLVPLLVNSDGEELATVSALTVPERVCKDAVDCVSNILTSSLSSTRKLSIGTTDFDVLTTTTSSSSESNLQFSQFYGDGYCSSGKSTLDDAYDLVEPEIPNTFSIEVAPKTPKCEGVAFLPPPNSMESIVEEQEDVVENIAKLPLGETTAMMPNIETVLQQPMIHDVGSSTIPSSTSTPFPMPAPKPSHRYRRHRRVRSEGQNTARALMDDHVDDNFLQRCKSENHRSKGHDDNFLQRCKSENPRSKGHVWPRNVNQVSVGEVATPDFRKQFTSMVESGDIVSHPKHRKLRRNAFSQNSHTVRENANAVLRSIQTFNRAQKEAFKHVEEKEKEQEQHYHNRDKPKTQTHVADHNDPLPNRRGKFKLFSRFGNLHVRKHRRTST